MELFALHSNFRAINTRFSVCGDKDVASLLHHMQPESKGSMKQRGRAGFQELVKFKAALKNLKSTFAFVNRAFSKCCWRKPALGCVLKKGTCPGFVPVDSISPMPRDKLNQWGAGVCGAAMPKRGESCWPQQVPGDAVSQSGCGVGMKCCVSGVEVFPNSFISQETGKPDKNYLPGINCKCVQHCLRAILLCKPLPSPCDYNLRWNQL